MEEGNTGKDERTVRDGERGWEYGKEVQEGEGVCTEIRWG